MEKRFFKVALKLKEHVSSKEQIVNLIRRKRNSQYVCIYCRTNFSKKCCHNSSKSHTINEKAHSKKVLWISFDVSLKLS